ncbi:DEAD/DEAH box helicase [Pseudooceanicola nitratireducens]|uniref:DEAD/DEAH box helicase n=1 Tax=Pseudooceanicola nitratireducens TaxID=517719 RepID=UPI001C97A486|nr:DEAD/DEAH box helicase [Pseudooceanicola nitratireducens]MBY6155917.1 DEAD/DEAH box helicase [Pseudooceanicola nitratireducens]
MVDYTKLPESFAELKEASPTGHSISERLLEPIARLEREENRIVARLGGVRMVRGERHEFLAPTNRHCWVVDGTIFRPLPRDAVQVLLQKIGDADPTDIPFSTAIRLMRSDGDGIAATPSETIMKPGKEAAELKSDTIRIAGLEAELFPYQARGVQWMWDTVSRTGGLILADEMGLGKTLQIIALLMIDPPSSRAPALIVCPTSLIANWVREIARFAPTLGVAVHRGAHRTGVVSGLQTSQVLITTYDTMVNDIAIFSSLEWSWVICDEAQAIKNPHSNRRQAIATIPRKRAIPMTGTPVENSLVDLWSLTDFAIPGLLGSLSEFEGSFPDSLDSGQQVKRLTDPIILKRRVADVASDLPERIDVDVPLELDDRLIDHYREVRDATMGKYPVAGALVATLQLQLVCAHPWLRNAGENEEDAAIVTTTDMPLVTPKMERVVTLLREAFANGRKVIVFALFNRIGDLLKQACSHMPDTHWGAINGSTPQEDRQTIIDVFAAHEGPACLILNPKAAGAGLNITAATVVIHFTPVWNPALEAQASARAHRRGQTEPVTIYRLFYLDTVEEVMIDRSAWKNDLANETVPVSTRDADDLKRALEIMPVKS